MPEIDWVSSASERRISGKPRSSYNYVQHTPPPSRATFPSLIACLYLLDSGIENDVSARLPNITSATCHLELWPPDPRRLLYALASAEDLCQFALKSVHSFSNCRELKLVTNERTNGQTDGHVVNIICPASLDWRMGVFIMLSAFCPQ